MNPAARAKQLATDHWAYIAATLSVHGVQSEELAILEHHYTTATIHGYKHGVEDVRSGMFDNPAAVPQPPLSDLYLHGNLCPSCQRKQPCKGDYPAITDGGCEGYIKATPEGADNCAHYNAAEKTCMGKPHMDCYRCEDYTRLSKGEPKAERKASLCHSCIKECGCTPSAKADCDKNGECPEYLSALRERMLDAEEEAITPKHALDCIYTDCKHHGVAYLRNCGRYPANSLSLCNDYEPLDPFAMAAKAKQDAPKTAELAPTHTDPATNCKDCGNTACKGIGRNVTCDQGCERFEPKGVAL